MINLSIRRKTKKNFCGKFYCFYDPQGISLDESYWSRRCNYLLLERKHDYKWKSLVLDLPGRKLRLIKKLSTERKFKKKIEKEISEKFASIISHCNVTKKRNV